MVGEARDRVPGGRGRSVDPEHEPAVPGKILELHGADEHRRVEARHRVVGDVLDAGGERRAEVFPLHRVAGDARATVTGERRNERALQIDAFDRIPVGGRFQALQQRFDLLPQVFIAGQIAQKKIGLKPSGSQPGGAGPTVDRDARASR